MRVLAIETSCDETAAAVADAGVIAASQVASQFEAHAAFGGIVPEIASRRHMETIDAIVSAVMEEAPPPYDAIAVTQGPGLIGALLVGVGYAKGLAAGMGVPLVAVDHLLAHVASVFIDHPHLTGEPFLCLLASGGHSLLLDVGADLSLSLVGQSRDDAAGEAFDKGARLLGLAQPGGPAIEQAAAQAKHPQPIPTINPAMVHQASCDMSFAGIKTALALHLRSGEQPTDIPHVASAYQDAIVETLAAACARALRATGHSRLAVVGGVAANQKLRGVLEEVCRQAGAELVTPRPTWCADNAAMVAVAAPFCRELAPAEADLLDAYPASDLSRTGTLAPTTTG